MPRGLLLFLPLLLSLWFFRFASNQRNRRGRKRRRRRFRLPLRAGRRHAIQSPLQLAYTTFQRPQRRFQLHGRDRRRFLPHNRLNPLLQRLVALLQRRDLLETRRDDLQSALQQLNGARQVIDGLALPILRFRQRRAQLRQRTLVLLR